MYGASTVNTVVVLLRVRGGVTLCVGLIVGASGVSLLAAAANGLAGQLQRPLSYLSC